ncbi:MAG: hypothetical protein AAF366_05990 [Pseudomonadota bacterium]
MDRIESASAGPQPVEGGADTTMGMLGGPDVSGSKAMAALGTTELPAPTYREAMANLNNAFNHAIEVELIAKTGTSMASSMNKLMSGN